MKRLLILVATLLVAASCGKNTCHVPIGDARGDIGLLNPDAYNLLHAGGSVFAHGGNLGMWVVNTGLGYVVFEATCPNCQNCAVDTLSGWAGLMQCPQCESKFNAYADGYPLNGSASVCPLHQYSCMQEGNVIHIYN